MKFHSHIGVLPEEKITGQRIEIDLIIETNFDFSGKDELSETLSYADFYEITKVSVEHSRVDLIETLAYEIAGKIKEAHQDKIQSVTIHVRKLDLPIDGVLDSTEVEMTR